jgi:thiol-disulfide isomerase/thioredoxin
MSDLTMGPFSFPAPLLVGLCAVLLGLVVANKTASGTGAGASAERLLWRVLAVALLAARAAFVVRYRAFYMEDPVRILDLRDGGFHPVSGLVAGLALGAWFAWRERGGRKALVAGMLAAGAAWLAGTGMLSLMTGPQAQLPALTFTDAQGREVPLQSFAGRPLVVNLWASWCPPCHREMPEFARAQRAYRGVTFVFVNQGEPAAAIDSYLREQGIRLDNVLLDRTNRLGKATGSPGLPTTLFFDAGGRLVDRRLGQLSGATLAERIEGLRPAAGVSGAPGTPRP